MSEESNTERSLQRLNLSVRSRNLITPTSDSIAVESAKVMTSKPRSKKKKRKVRANHRLDSDSDVRS